MITPLVINVCALFRINYEKKREPFLTNVLVVSPEIWKKKKNEHFIL